MLTLVIGPNNSGKSAYAESVIAGLESRKSYYIATMIPFGEEGQARVRKHLKMREHLGMETLEDPYLEKIDTIETGADVLLEDVSNLVANRLFERGIEACESILQDIVALNEKVSNLVIVSIGGIIAEGYDQETICYINMLNQMNEELRQLADQVVIKE